MGGAGSTSGGGGMDRCPHRRSSIPIANSVFPNQTLSYDMEGHGLGGACMWPHVKHFQSPHSHNEDKSVLKACKPYLNMLGRTLTIHVPVHACCS